MDKLCKGIYEIKLYDYEDLLRVWYLNLRWTQGC